MNKRAPAFQFYPDKWLAGADHLSDQSYRAYHKILCWMWLHSDTGYSMTDNETMWTIATGKTDKRIREEILNPDFPLLQIDGDILTSNGLRKEVEKQQEWSKKQSGNANKRWNKKTLCHRKATAKPPVCSPSPSPSPSPSLIPSHLLEIWKDFEELRKKKRQPLTNRAIKNILATLSKHPEDVQIKMIDQSITCGYTGIFELKESYKNTDKKSNLSIKGINYREGLE
jgi:uncharacterized protein YdaU (DUF1376 family)